MAAISIVSFEAVKILRMSMLSSRVSTFPRVIPSFSNKYGDASWFFVVTDDVILRH